MLIVQISDMHVTLPGKKLYGKIDTHGGMVAAIRHIAAMRPAPDLVVATGDLVHSGTEEEYATLAELLAPLDMPVYLLAGNHDDRTMMRRVLTDHDYLAGDDFIQYVIEEHPIRLVALDTVVPGEVAGALCERRLAWLEAELAREPDRPTIVMMHHPPFTTGVGYMDRMGLRDPDALAAIIARHPQVKRILCGHDHRPIHSLWKGTFAAVAPSTAHQMRLIFEPEREGEWMFEPAGCLVHHWDGENGLATHLSYIGDYGEPQQFIRE